MADARRLQGAGEFRALCQEAISRVHRVGSGRPRGLDHVFDVQIRLLRRGRADVDGLVGQLHGQHVRVRLGMGLNHVHAHGPRGPHDANGDFPPIGDKQAFDGHSAPSSSASSCPATTGCSLPVR